MVTFKRVAAEIAKSGITLGETVVVLPLAAGWVASKGLQVTAKMVEVGSRESAHAMVRAICEVDRRAMDCEEKLEDWARRGEPVVV